ncbi:hypothetical protein F4819DRAFT_502465 [Hypoxylon fuscum]|nr:hypothetical protein F4819DRAFT_502465 [Hypoxylon fuscum]
MELIERAYRLPAIFRSIWKWLRREQSQDSLLLQLPLELVYLVAEFLTPVDLALLSQTCRSLQAALKGYSNASHLCRTEYLTYLAGLARGLPEKWVCEGCMTLHPIVRFDTPGSKYHKSYCPLKSVTSLRYGPPHYKIPDDDRLRCKQIPIGHRHVQLALKYTRLKCPEYKSYLQALIAPHHDMQFKPSRETLLKTHYSAYPRIVAGDDGNLRFLLLSTWRYYKGRKDILLHELGYQMICPHLRLNCGPCVLESATEKALKARGNGRERTGACPRCATDFSVQLTSGYLSLRVWQDFGSEGSPVDLAWKSQCAFYNSDSGLNCRYIKPTLYHKPGSIKK